jgi:hypothetical protein
MGREEVHTGFCWGNLRVKDNWEDPEGEKILERISKEWERGGARTGFIWLGIGTGGGLL